MKASIRHFFLLARQAGHSFCPFPPPSAPERDSRHCRCPYIAPQAGRSVQEAPSGPAVVPVAPPQRSAPPARQSVPAFPPCGRHRSFPAQRSHQAKPAPPDTAWQTVQSGRVRMQPLYPLIRNPVLRRRHSKCCPVGLSPSAFPHRQAL